jgi:uncharacterized membrane protein (DUF106 family)
MDALGSIFGAAFDGFVAVFGWLGPGWSLTVLSVLLGVAMLFAFKWIGEPGALERAMAKMQAYMMEMRLFDREPKLVFGAMGRLFWWNFKLFAALLRPVLVATLPMILLFIQMDHYYGMRPLEVGESTVVTAKVEDREAFYGPILLTAEDGAVVETLGVRSPERGIVSWRVRAEQEGVSLLTLSVGEEEITKTLTVGEELQRVSKRRARRAADAMLFPVEPRLPAGAVAWVDVRYPAISVSVLGIPMHWLVWLFIISLVGALVVRWIVNFWRPGSL